MFSKDNMTVFDWWVYFIVMMIPVVNIIVFLIILLSSSSNKSVRSLEFAVIIPLLIFGFYIYTSGVPQTFMGRF